MVQPGKAEENFTMKLKYGTVMTKSGEGLKIAMESWGLATINIKIQTVPKR